jgi:hypothetical protein
MGLVHLTRTLQPTLNNMTSTELSQLTIKELKAIALENDIEVIGDKRLKATYILSIAQAHPLMAIETFQSQQTVIEIIETLPAIPDPFENQLELAIETESIDLPPVPTAQHHGASVVVLIPLILLSLAVISIRIGIGALIPLIAAVGRLLVSIGRSITGTDRGTDSIPFPRMKPYFCIANGHY